MFLLSSKLRFQRGSKSKFRIVDFVENGKLKVGHSPRGSILIWTVLISTLLASSFLFLVVRFGGGRALINAAMEQHSQKQYLASVMDYLKWLPAEDIANYKSDSLSFDDGLITGSLTNEVLQIEDVLDADTSRAFANMNQSIVVRFNRCDLGESGLIETDHPIGFSLGNQCALGDEYDHFFTAAISSPFWLTAPSSPTHYQITSTTPGSWLESDEWTVYLRLNLGYGRKIEMSEQFTTASSS